ncbi:MAG: hypothetical protein R3A10_13895 [Caldilineaceae bacterium]
MLASFAGQPGPGGVNTLVAGVADVRAELRAAGFTLTPLPWYAAAFTVPRRNAALVNAGALNAGRIYAGSIQHAGRAGLGRAAGRVRADLAAAPGGKTFFAGCACRARARWWRWSR